MSVNGSEQIATINKYHLKFVEHCNRDGQTIAVYRFDPDVAFSTPEEELTFKIDYAKKLQLAFSHWGRTSRIAILLNDEESYAYPEDEPLEV